MRETLRVCFELIEKPFSNCIEDNEHFYMIFFQLSALELNNTRHAKKEVLFFNRVPKVGSQTTMELLKALSIKNQFKYHKDRTQKVETIKLTYNEEVIELITAANYCVT